SSRPRFLQRLAFAARTQCNAHLSDSLEYQSLLILAPVRADELVPGVFCAIVAQPAAALIYEFFCHAMVRERLAAGFCRRCKLSQRGIREPRHSLHAHAVAI